MSNVASLAKAREKKDPGHKWGKLLKKHGEMLCERLYDQIRLADSDAEHESIPEQYTDCMILGVIAHLVVEIAERRNILSPEELLGLIKYNTERPYNDA